MSERVMVTVIDVPMTSAEVGGEAHQAPAEVCDRCGRVMHGRSRFSLDGEALCLRCVVRHGKLLWRSALIALLMGTVLTAVNNGGVIASGGSAALAWKVPLTYCSPFLVATWGGIVNARMKEGSSTE